MKTIATAALIEGLQADIRAGILQVSYLEHISPDTLMCRPVTGGWSIAQVLEHLNIYCRVYLNAIEDKLHFHQTTPNATFTPGILGNYFTRLMKPSDNKAIRSKMKAAKLAVPSVQPGAKEMLQEFLQHQHHMLNLLQVASSANLEHIRITTFLSRLIKLKLGDMFRFLVAHQQRHFVQVERILQQVQA